MPGSPALNYAALEARAQLTRKLAAALAYCAGRHYIAGRWRAPTLPAMPVLAGVLAEPRVLNRLAADPAGPAIARELGTAVSKAKRALERVPRQYLGECQTCGGPVYVKAGEELARCRDCRTAFPAEALRTARLAELDDRLCTAAECARLATYLGLRDDRDRVRKRINTWSTRGRLTVHGSGGAATFRFGEVWRALLAEEARR